MSQFKFVSYLIVITDIHGANTSSSIGVQFDQKTIADLPGMRAKYKQSLTSLVNGGLGSEAN